MAPGEPATGRPYRRQSVEGITFHLHPSLVQVAGQVRVSLGGFWKLRWLKVEGAAATAACAV